MIDLKNREFVRVLTSHVDAELLDRWLPASGGTDVRAAVAGLADDLGRALAARVPVPRLIGFVISDVVEMRGPRARVGINVLVELHAEPPLIAALRRGGDHPLEAPWLAGKWGEVMRQLTPEQRELTLTAMSEGYTVLAPIFVELVPRGAEWKVVDIEIPPLESMRVAALIDDAVKSRPHPPPAPAAVPAPAPRPAPQVADGESGPSGSRLLVMLVGGLATAMIAFFVLRRLVGRARA